MNDAEFEESDDEDDVARQRTGAASQKRARLDAEETAPKDPATAAVTSGDAPTPSSAILSPLPPTATAPTSPSLDHPTIPPPIGESAPAGHGNGQTEAK